MTMANSIELRVPLLDKEMELKKNSCKIQSTPNETTKYAFRKAAQKAIPKGLVIQGEKVGFLVPFVSFIKEEKYYKIVKEMFNKDFVKEFFDKEKINKLLDDHLIM